MQHTFDCGIDRHVDWMSVCVLQAEGEGCLHQNSRTDSKTFLQVLQPCREDGVVGVEGRFTWSWRAALCADEGMPFGLGHALYMRAMHGGTAKHDRIDSHKSAALRRGGLMPQADVYPRRRRATRELWRRRKQRMPQRAEWSAHLQQTASQEHLREALGRIAKPQNRRGLIARVDPAGVQQHRAVDPALLDGDEPRLADVERSREQPAPGHEPVSRALLRPIPGVGTSLALVRRYAMEAIARLARLHAFGSDCRLVKRARESDGKRHGPSAKQIGHAHLQWAFSDAAVRLRQHNAPATPSLTQLATRHGQGKALALLAHTRGRAVYGMRQPPVAFAQAKCLVTSGGRQWTSLASHGSPRGQRHHDLRIAPSAHARGTRARTSGGCAERQSRPPGALMGGPFRSSSLQPRAHMPG
jgi:transposase